MPPSCFVSAHHDLSRPSQYEPFNLDRFQSFPGWFQSFDKEP